MTHAGVREQLEGYVLGALEPAEAEAVRDHLAGCPECTAEFEALQRVTDALPAALATASPLRVHQSLRRRILAGVPGRSRERRGLRRWLPPAVAVLSVVLFVGSGLYALSLRQQLAADQVLHRESLGQAQLSPQEQYRVLEVIDSSTTTRRLLRSVDPDHPDAYGKLWTRADDADVVVMVDRLPAPSSGEAYLLTLTTADGRTVTAGDMTVDPDGFAMMLFTADRKGPAYRSAVVTKDGTPMVLWSSSA